MRYSQFFTIQQIDAIKGIRTPHDRDLRDLGKKYIAIFKEQMMDQMSIFCELLGVKMEELNFGETWALTKEFFPEVKIHMLLQYDDEGLSAEPHELQFLFSGTRVTWLSGEDLCHLCEILVNYAISKITQKLPQDVYTGIPSPMLSKALKERDIDWSTIPMDRELHHSLVFSPFPEVEIEYDIASTPISFSIKSKKLQEFWIYDIDRLVIMGLNQILRLVKIRMGTDAPSICDMMFSGYYKKNNPLQFQ